MSQSHSGESKTTSSMIAIAAANLRGHLGGTLSLAAGVAVATAVITGALLVGDSMRGSLWSLTQSRIGNIESIIIPGHFFSVQNKDAIDGVHAVTLMPGGTAESSRNGQDRVRYGGTVNVIGIDPTFWKLDPRQSDGSPPSDLKLDDDSVLLNKTLATELDVQVGDLVTVRLPSASAVPADSPLGRREVASEGLPRMRVAAIEDTGLFNFAITPNQSAPRNVFLLRSVIGDVLDRDDSANALFISSTANSANPNDAGQKFSIGVESSHSIELDLADLGVKLEMAEQRFQDETVFQYASLTSDQLLLGETVVETLRPSVPAEPLNDDAQAQPVMTYLANAITKIEPNGSLGASVPYSILTATDASDDLPLVYETQDNKKPETETLTEPETPPAIVPMVINDWTADRLDAAIGDRVRVFYYEPEVESGVEIERHFDAVITQIVPITKPAKPYRRRRPAVFDQAPTRFNDPFLTPSVPGVTDQDSINDWDLPFPLERTIDKADDEYWQDYRLTPKAFVPLQTGQRLFGSRFGDVTSIRYPSVTPEQLPELSQKIQQQLGERLPDLGWSPINIREQQERASAGTTPFDGLFLALSMFVIFAAILLIAMLCKLSLTVRSKQLATLAAVGWPPARIMRLFLSEGLLTSILGATLGAVTGIAYAWLMIQGLRTRWVGAVTTSFLELHLSLQSIVIGWCVGIAIAGVVVYSVVRRMTQMSPARMLAGNLDSVANHGSSNKTKPGDDAKSSNPKRFQRWIDGCLVATIIGLMMFAIQSGGMTAAGLFVAAGMLLLVECLWVLFRRLRDQPTGRHAARRTTSIAALVFGTAARNPLRSTLAVGLMSIASFMVVSMTAFSLQPTESGIGGFNWMATTASPVYRDLSDPTVRSGLLGSDAENLKDAVIEPMRMRSGQDASCNNLYRAAAPTVLGVRRSMITSTESIDFQWAAHDIVGGIGDEALQNESKIADDTKPIGLENRTPSPWQVLFDDRQATGQESSPIPVVIDQNTAMWSLGLTRGVGQMASFEFENSTVYFRVAGLLANSTLQGRLMISEPHFNLLFPDISGYQSFLIRTDGDDVDQILESRLNDLGMDVRDSRIVLSELLAVQNTYLSTFQSLGALGLLLGTIGLAIASVRSVLARRGELAVMRAVGFTKAKLSTIVMGETAVLLLIGIGIGVGSATIALVPTLWSRGGGSVLGPITTIAFVLVFGIASGTIGVAKVVRMPLVASLRSDH